MRSAPRVVVAMSVQLQEPPAPDVVAKPLTERHPARARHGMLTALVVGAAALAGATVGSILTAAVVGNRTVVVTTGAPFTAAAPAAPTTGPGAVAAALRPSVVAIEVGAAGRSDVGSGVVIRSDGMVLTADHVIAAGGPITVTLADGRKRSAHVIGRFPKRDLAVIRADAVRALAPATFGSARHLRVGDDVLVMGNPLGFRGTVTRGIVSALHRSIPVGGEQPTGPVDPLLGLPPFAPPTAFVRDAIQTDAAVNPGNSGGPLVDMAGHVVGIMTTVVSRGPGDPDTGLGFAIPSDLAWPTANQVMAPR